LAAWPAARRPPLTQRIGPEAIAGWVGDRLYLKVYPSKNTNLGLDTARLVGFEPAPGATDVVRAAAGRYADAVDWRAVDKAAQERIGAPVIIADCSAAAPRLDKAQKPEDEEASIIRAVRPHL